MNPLAHTYLLDLLGFALLFRTASRRHVPAVAGFLVCFPLAILVTSLAMIACLGLNLPGIAIVAPWALFCGLAIFAIGQANWQIATTAPGPRPTLTVAIVSGAACLLAIGSVLVASFNTPHGGWDAFALWNLKARFIFSGLDQDQWTLLFSKGLAFHPDYPLLQPATIARYWLAIGEPTPLVPILLAALSMTVCLGLLFMAVQNLNNPLSACAAVVMTLSATFFIQHAASQYADNFFALLVLLATVLIALETRSLVESRPGGTASWMLPAIALALTAGIKNEGNLVSLVFFFYILVSGFRHSVTNKVKFLGQLAAGIAIWGVFYAPHFYLNRRFQVGNDIVQGTSIDRLQELLDFNRLRQLIEQIAPLAMDFYMAPIILIGGLLVLGWRPDFRRDGYRLGGLLAALLAVTAGYIAVLWATPHDLSWHIHGAFQRLLIHTWPAGVFVLFTALSPETDKLKGSV